MSVRRAAAVEAPLVPDRLRTVLRAGLERQRRNNEPVCRGCGPKIDAYYEEYRLAVNDNTVDGARKTGVDWRNDATCAICLDPLAGPAGGVDVEDKSVEALVENVTVKRCNHVFHTACLKPWIQSGHRNCPTCQTPIDPAVVLRLKGVVGKYGNLVALEGPGGQVAYHEGPRGEGRMVLAETRLGDVEYYDGPRGEERMVRKKSWNGSLLYYEGPKGEERLVRTDLSNGVVLDYEGPRNEERLVRKKSRYVLLNYEGPKGEERLVRAELWNGVLLYHEGPRGEERMVLKKSPDGAAEYYDGPKGEERMVRKEWPDGTVQYYQGPKGEEHKVRTEFADGAAVYFKGPKGEERIVRKELAGDMLHRVEDMDAHA